jgi:glycosyltransferase involved in cell wall biosynthesis
MRVLWIKMGGLWPLNTGGRQRTFHLLSELSRRNPVELLTTHNPADDPDGLRDHLPGASVTSLPYTVAKRGSREFLLALARSWASPYPVDLWRWRASAMRRALATRLQHPVDVIVADFMVAEPNLPRRRPAPVVFFTHNVEHLIWKRLAGVERQPVRRALLELEWRKMRAMEVRAVRRADRTVAVSEEDAGIFRAAVPAAPIDVIATGVDLTYFTSLGSRPVPRRLVFSGSMDWYPNEDAMLSFIGSIWPRLRAARPDVSLTIVGRHPTARLRAFAGPAGVTVTGTVEDVRPYVDEAELFIVPLRVGGGTRLKVFEALAMGKAVVSTTIGVEGLGLEPGRHFVAADDPASFANAILQLFDAEDRRRALGEAGRALVEARYGWPRVAREFEASLEQAVRGREIAQSCSAGRVAVSPR